MATVKPDIQVERVWMLLAMFGAILLIAGWYDFVW
jgi:hypothetical protein